MKKIFLFTFLISLATLVNAQSKVDSTIKNADTTIFSESEKLNKAKIEINRIQSKISDLIKQKEINQDQIAKLNKNISKLSEIRNISKTELAELDKAKSDLKQSLNQDSTILINLDKEIGEAKKKIESLKQDIASITKEKKSADTTLAQRKASIALQLDSVETIAIIEMLDSTKIHTPKGASIKAKIEEVRINVIQGIILEIIVKTDQGIFRNKGKANKGGMVIADLLHLGAFIDKKLRIEPYSRRSSLDDEAKSSAYILLKDVILYTPVSSYTNAVYGEFEIALFPTQDKRFYIIKESTSINTYFNVAAFTDIKGINGEPNGVAQFTADAKFMLNTRSIPKTSMVYANYISFQGGLSKFDSQFKGTELKTDIVDRKDLFQRVNYKVGIKLNLLKGYLPPNPVLLYNTFELNAGYNVMGSQIFKTDFKDVAQTVIDTAFRTVTQNQWYAEPSITFSRRKNFSMCLAFPYYLNNIKKSESIQNNNTEHWVVPGISLMYFGKRDVGSKIFFRYNHYINIKDKTQAFSQMQLGYSLNLTQVINNK
jgi:predicted  nucleic acid-binding Zn-ribbon protein